MVILKFYNALKLSEVPTYLLLTLEEQLKGRLTSISKCATKPELLVVAYRNLRITQIYFCSMNLLNFDDAAYSYYQSLRQQKIQVGTQDLRIPA
ncbi:hypothetical protein [Nostoc sp.]|uniref:hypothetical protein n=1 Tax=Nostoc sp. TaxID=1180 RepID=UPI002FF7906F